MILLSRRTPRRATGATSPTAMRWGRSPSPIFHNSDAIWFAWTFHAARIKFSSGECYAIHSIRRNSDGRSHGLPQLGTMLDGPLRGEDGGQWSPDSSRFPQSRWISVHCGILGCRVLGESLSKRRGERFPPPILSQKGNNEPVHSGGS